jgi:DNA-binding response OmpR family regulator
MKILVVDDDRVLAEIMVFTLQRAGFDVIQARDGASALRRWEEEDPSLIILDVNLPDIDGFTVCQRIREQADTPIILLTVRGEEDDIVHGLEIGADDYITKPYSPRQLVARTQAVLRRASTAGSATTDATMPARRRASGLELDLNRREVRVGDGEPLSLTPLELQLLDYLMVNAGHVLTTEALIDQVWGPGGANRSMLRQLVHRLRQKIEPDPSQPIYIETVPGLGYGFVAEE